MVPSDLTESGTCAARAWSAATLGRAADGVLALPPPAELPESPPHPATTRAAASAAVVAAARRVRNRVGTVSPSADPVARSCPATPLPRAGIGPRSPFR